jgi:hypothetical protein
MIDGMKIILERVKTHPEEFVNDLGQISRWENLVQMYHHILTAEEKKAFDDALHELKRQRFTSRVLEILVEEPQPVVVDDWWNKSQTVPNNAYGSSTLSIKEAVLKEQEARMRQAMLTEYSKIQLEATDTQSKQQKNQSKMEQLLKRVTGSKY